MSCICPLKCIEQAIPKVCSLLWKAPHTLRKWWDKRSNEGMKIYPGRRIGPVQVIHMLGKSLSQVSEKSLVETNSHLMADRVG
jgi:hypothetical protein